MMNLSNISIVDNSTQQSDDDILRSTDNIELISTEDLRIEQQLTTLMGYCQNESISNEAITPTKALKNIAALAKNTYKGIGVFIKHLDMSIRNRMVDEQYIVNRFQAINEAIAKIETPHAFVLNVPKYDAIAKRLAGLMSVGKHVERLAGNPNQGRFDDQLFTRIATLSNGAVKADAPYQKDTSFKNIIWAEPTLERSYEVKASKWAKPKDVAIIRDLVIGVKYDTIIALKQAITDLGKYYDRYVQEEPVISDPYGSSGYEPTDNTADMVNALRASYVGGKIIKQLTAVIHKEVNMVSITYAKRLATPKIK